MTKEDLYRRGYRNFIYGIVVGSVFATVIIKTLAASATEMTASVEETSDNCYSTCVAKCK